MNLKEDNPRKSLHRLKYAWKERVGILEQRFSALEARIKWEDQQRHLPFDKRTRVFHVWKLAEDTRNAGLRGIELLARATSCGYGGGQRSPVSDLHILVDLCAEIVYKCADRTSTFFGKLPQGFPTFSPHLGQSPAESQAQADKNAEIVSWINRQENQDEDES